MVTVNNHLGSNDCFWKLYSLCSCHSFVTSDFTWTGNQGVWFISQTFRNSPSYHHQFKLWSSTFSRILLRKHSTVEKKKGTACLALSYLLSFTQLLAPGDFLFRIREGVSQMPREAAVPQKQIRKQNNRTSCPLIREGKWLEQCVQKEVSLRSALFELKTYFPMS